jgi:drug/metabolite transporter (DMT)-like permease
MFFFLLSSFSLLFPSTQFIGEIAALSAAFLWAAASVVYTQLGVRIPPLQLNFYKGIIAIALIIITLMAQQANFSNISLATILWLSLSGVLGIGLGDTAYFAALNSLGARRTLLLETLSPPLGALLALIFIGERLTFLAWCGILLTVLGIICVISERTPASVSQNISIGIIWGILAAIAQAGGAVISRFALLQSDISPLASTLIRLLAGNCIVLLLLLLPLGRRQPQIQGISAKTLGAIAIAATGSTYLGIWLQQTSLKFSPTGIAQTLLATSPLFILPIVAFMGEIISIRAILGVLLSLSGIGLLFFSQ